MAIDDNCFTTKKWSASILYKEIDSTNYTLHYPGINRDFKNVFEKYFSPFFLSSSMHHRCVMQ